MKADCWKREKQANYVEKNEENSKLFMTHSQIHNISNDIWFLDSGCSNHMSGIKSIFRYIDETHKLNVRLGDNKQIKWKHLVLCHANIYYNQTRFLISNSA